MRYEIKNQTVTFFLDNPKRANETTVNQSFAGTGLSELQVIPLTESLIRKFCGQSLRSQIGITSVILRPIFAYFETTGSSWPTTSSDWQITVYRFFHFFLVDKGWSQSSAEQRMRLWSKKIASCLEFLIEDEIIPCDINIPKIELKKIRSLANDQPLLGQHRASVTDVATQPQKLLVDINFGMTDADYLDAVEKKCRHLVGVIRDVCLMHWDGLMQDGKIGRQLAGQVTDTEIIEAFAAGRFGTYHATINRIKQFNTSHTHLQGHNWALAIARYKLANGTEVGCVSIPTLRASPFFSAYVFGNEKYSHTALDNLTSMTREQWLTLPIPARFYRFSGLLSNIDVAAVCCLLTIEHPEFTSDSLQDAKLLNVRGKPYLLMSDSNESSILSLNKPRAGTRKSVVLTSLSQKLVMDIIRWTAPVREVLRRSGDKTWRYLFLGRTQSNGINGYLGIVEGKPLYLTGGVRSIALTTLYPVLSQNGLTKGSFDYRRLRNTMGVLRWFETGSIVEMSRRLGNTRKVALEHYLPPALLHAWNTRIIRRFQNTLIVLAAHNKPYLLEVTDFSSMADLQYFIAQLIVDYPARTSPLADEVQKRLGNEQQRDAESAVSMPGLLSVRLSPESLGLLYSYSNLALRTLAPDELDKVDVLSGLAPRQFTEIATLLRHAAESDRIHASLSESLNVPLLKQVHADALAIQVGLDAQFARLSIKHCWSESA